jgi:osmotically-inducible protein OsmY
MSRRLVPVFAAALAAGLALAACEKSDQQKLKADAKDAWKDTREAASNTAENVKRETKEATGEAGKALKQAGETTGQIVEDAAITAKVKAALLAEKNVRSRDVEVETFQGKVVLKGHVPDRAQVDLAVKVARSVEGVTAVENRIAVN